jgi:hypothetical protein
LSSAIAFSSSRAIVPAQAGERKDRGFDLSRGHDTLFLFERKVQNAARRLNRPRRNVNPLMNDIHSRLMHQSLGRPLTPGERALAEALEAVFSSGEQDFEGVARALERKGVKRPSGATGPWTAAVLEQELATINASLDAAYAQNGIGA